MSFRTLNGNNAMQHENTETWSARSRTRASDGVATGLTPPAFLRPLRRAKGPRPLSLGLQGGGSFGALTWGVLDRLLAEDDLALDAVSGASAGAVNAAALAHGLATGCP